jgi:hypothetical protein
MNWRRRIHPGTAPLGARAACPCEERARETQEENTKNAKGLTQRTQRRGAGGAWEGRGRREATRVSRMPLRGHGLLSGCVRVACGDDWKQMFFLEGVSPFITEGD